MTKIALLGNEISIYFTNILVDLIYVQPISSHLYFYHENEAMAQLLLNYGNVIADGSPVKIHRATTIEEALEKADGLIYAHDAQSTSRYHMDVNYLKALDPEGHFLGSRSPYTGLSGLLQGLRQGTAAMAICEKVQKLSPKLKTIILSHNATALIHLFDLFDLEAIGIPIKGPKENEFIKDYLFDGFLTETGIETLPYTGLEHFTWLSEKNQKENSPFLQKISQYITSHQNSSSLIVKWYEHYNAIAYGNVNYIGQFFPPQPEVLPMDEVVFTETVKERKERILLMNHVVKHGKDAVEGKKAQVFLLSKVGEHRPGKILYQFLGKTPVESTLSVLQKNLFLQVNNLPKEAVIINPLSLDNQMITSYNLPFEVAILAKDITSWQIAMAKATFGDWESIRLCLETDIALANTDSLAVFSVFNELLTQHQEILPQFFNE